MALNNTELFNLMRLQYHNFIPFVLLMFVMTMTMAQQEAQFTQYMFNTGVFNPSYSGTRGTTNATGLYRTQWVGLDGAPTTQSFNFDTSFENRNTGLGLTFTNDALGPSQETAIAVNYAYRINLTEDYKLSLGIGASFDFLHIDIYRLEPDQPEVFDPIDDSNPNVGVGFFLYSETAYLGVSVPKLLRTTYYDDNEITAVDALPHLYIIGGKVFDLSSSTKLKPAFLYKTVAGAPAIVDLSANFLFNERLTLGAAYRWDAAVSGLAGFQISNSLLIGYAYDRYINGLGAYNSGSHEVFIKFNFNRNCRNCEVRNTRFF